MNEPAEREDIIRVMRIVEYTGPRSAVEAAVARSIQGEKTVGGGEFRDKITIRATTLGTFPEILESAVLIQALKGEPTEKDLWIAKLERELKAAREYRQMCNAQNWAIANAQSRSGPQNAYGTIPLPSREAQDLQQQMSIIGKIKSSFGL